MGSNAPELGGAGGADWLGSGPDALGWLGSPQAPPIIAAARSSVADRRRLGDRVMCAEA
jgi:hypothetical protein